MGAEIRLLHVVGARPNFMKTAPVMKALAAQAPGAEQTLVHTGQHYDDRLSRYLFEDLDLPRPDVNLGIGSGTQAVQTANAMIQLEPIVRDLNPNWVVTVGDVNSTLAAALVASKLGVPVAHIEAGLRSRDLSMPEEINRLVTDRLSSALYTTEPSANDNLLQEGVAPDRVHFVGNVMIDTLDRLLDRAVALDVARSHDLEPESYVLVTLHRPFNVDDPVRLGDILTALDTVAAQTGRDVVVPMHPRTAQNVEEHGLQQKALTIRVLEPLRYLEFLSLMQSSGLVLTDSGGIQEETTVLGIPCITLRPNTERPVTITEGTNRLFDSSLTLLPDVVAQGLTEGRRPHRPALWDGRASERVARSLLDQAARRESEGPDGR